MSQKDRKPISFRGGRRGPVVPVPKGKVRITIRIDEDVVEWFKKQVTDAGGGSYQNLMNAALREHIKNAGEPLEATLRRVVREEVSHLRAVK